MGYYSTVALAMKNESAEKLVRAYNEHYKEAALFEECKQATNGKYTAFYWDCVKWYYEDIDFVMNYLNEDLDEDTEPYYFFRIGADREDVEEIYNAAEAEDSYIRDNIFCPRYIMNFSNAFSSLES